MSCTRGKASPSSHTKLRLFADSAGYCQNPNCLKNLFLDIGKTNIHIAEMAHIFSATDGGPRTNTELTPEERGDYANLILLCTNCHTMIDKAEEEFPDSLISLWKKQHTEKIKILFGAKECLNRQEARSLIEPILLENETIFKIYGPEGDVRYDPESDIPTIWKRKILSNILPNNRKLLSIIDANINYLLDPEKTILEEFRQHVDDFEAKHLDISDNNGIRFPDETKNIFKE